MVKDQIPPGCACVWLIPGCSGCPQGFGTLIWGEQCLTQPSLTTPAMVAKLFWIQDESILPAGALRHARYSFKEQIFSSQGLPRQEFSLFLGGSQVALAEACLLWLLQVLRHFSLIFWLFFWPGNGQLEGATCSSPWQGKNSSSAVQGR